MSTEEMYTEWRSFAIGVATLCSSKIMQNFHQRSHVLCSSNKVQGNGDSSLQVSIKVNNADLVTEIDQEIENTIRSMIQEKYPEHKFIGEESIAGSSGQQRQRHVRLPKS